MKIKIGREHIERLLANDKNNGYVVVDIPNNAVELVDLKGNVTSYVTVNMRDAVVVK